MIAVPTAVTRERTTALVRQVVVLVSWAAVYFVVVLAVMSGLIKVATGWDAVVITGASMSPTLNPGDVVFTDRHPDEAIGQRSVITFRRDDGELVTHRVFEANAADPTYITKGDANPSPDTDPVRADDVVGVGWLVVPYIGLPVLWVTNGDTAALAAIAVIVLVSIVTVASTARHDPHAGDESDDRADRFSGTAQRGIARVRLVVAVMMALLLVVNGRAFGFDVIGLTGVQAVAIALCGLALVSLLAATRSKRTGGTVARRFAVVELAGDTLVVVFFVMASGTSGVGWILMALPIIEATIHFRLTGAFVHWIVMTAVSVAVLFWLNRVTDVPLSVAVDRLEQLVDRMGVLLLVVIPGAFLAEQLLGDVVLQRRATTLAEERSRMIEAVNDAGRDVARLGTDLFPTLVEATLDLGFDVADCWIGDPDGGWQPLAATGGAESILAMPGERGSALCGNDLSVPEVFIAADDPDPDEFAAITLDGLDAVVRITLAEQDSMHVVLRAGATRLSNDPSSQAMALRLLTSQAAVALQNERLLSELRRTHTEMEHRARFDPLTDLANRAHFVDVLGETLGRADLDCPRTFVVFLDLDGFKAVNDRLGHLAGDVLLSLVSERLATAVGEHGIVARLGGDEFTVLLVDQDEAIADEIATSIHDHLVAPFDLSGDRIAIGASVGIAQAERGVAASEMLRRADVAMYAAKTNNGRRTTRYSVELDERERRSQKIAEAIGAAIVSGGLRMAYQPIVSTRTGDVVGVEALVRWTHPELGVIPPPEILDAAESADCVDALNRWIFETSLVDVASCEAAGGDEPFVAVNVTPGELELESLTDNMNVALGSSGLCPSRVVVELSERIVAESIGLSANVERLCGLGLRLALDDFGEGHTSLAHLRGLPISFLKLDCVLVQHAEESAEDRTILRSVVGLAHQLGFEVIAEGVENIEQHTIVTKAGSGLAQGFGLHRPMPIDELRLVLTRSTSHASSFGELAAAGRIGPMAPAFPPPMTERVG